jgi:hypothetical protein
MLKRILGVGAVLVALSGAAAAQEPQCVYPDDPDGLVGMPFEIVVQAWLPCAEAGDAEAQFQVAMAYLNTGDVATTIKWLESAIAAGRLMNPPPAWLGYAVEVLASLR